MSPAVTIGPMPSSIREPLCEAKMTRRYRNGSPCCVGTPYIGTSVIIRYKMRARAVQNIFSLNPTLRCGGLTSGVILDMGLNSDRNLPAMWRLHLGFHKANHN